MSFTRRFVSQPAQQTIQQIEGVVLVSQNPPGAVAGAGTGTVACVGEFPDFTYAGLFTNGVFATRCQPVQIFGSQDMMTKVGGFDPTIGDLGNSGGNGFNTLRSKQYNNLVLAPVNLASAQGVRVVRQLPANVSATSPSPVVPIVGATVPAGTQFQPAPGVLLNIGRAINFLGSSAYDSGIDGSVTSTSSAENQTFTIVGVSVSSASLVRAGGVVTATVGAVPTGWVVGTTIYLSPGETNFPAGAKVITGGNLTTTFQYAEAGINATSTTTEIFSLEDFIHDGAQVGDVLVLGVIGGAAGLGANAATYRVTAVTSGHQLQLERMDGGAFNWTTIASLPWRLHVGQCADSSPSGGAVTNSIASGSPNSFDVPARPLASSALWAVTPGAVVHTGTGTSVVTLTGTPIAPAVVSIAITTGGTVGTSFSLQATVNGVAGPIVPMGTATTYLVPGTGVTANFAAGTTVTADTYTFSDLNTILQPVQPVPAFSATSWSPTSGMECILGPSGITYTAGVQAPNAVASTALDTLYTSALSSLLGLTQPAKSVNIVFSSRSSPTIRSQLLQHETLASAQGVGRVAVTSPPLQSENSISTLSTSNILSAANPGVGANRDQGLGYAWPGCQIYVPECAGLVVPLANGTTTTTGNIDLPMDSMVASILSMLNPEQNPGEESDEVAALTNIIVGFQSGLAADLVMNDYINLKANGVMALVHEDNGFFIESGVTSSLVSGQQNMNRIRFQYFLQDSLAVALKPFAKQVLTQALKDAEVGEVIGFVDGLLSPSDPSSQRINGYTVDDVNGNTPALLAAGVFTIITAVQMTPTQDQIVLQTQVGTTVQVTVTNGSNAG